MGVVPQRIEARECHPAAALFPMLVGDEFDRLLADIKEHGVREAGWLDTEGRILDGRNRERACEQLRLDMPWRIYQGEPGTEVAFIVSLNLRRRHLTDDQRAAIAAELANLRQGDNRFTVDTPTGGSIRQAAAAKAMKVPVRRVQRAAVVKKASPKLHEEVKAGKVKLATAVAEVKPKAATSTKQKASTKKNNIGSAPPVALSSSPALSGTENTTTTANMRNIVERFVTAVEQIETWAEEIEGRLDEVAAADRRMIVAVVSRSEKALRAVATALGQA